ncbi:CAP domain-containing protein [Ramlibacter sp. PS4R-6]|uniref:CAP domain-containing protein n=1 Tax=Ramlibacter sp. PS4R-6 TaxID=3133438 RepID=UPI0030B15021
MASRTIAVLMLAGASAALGAGTGDEHLLSLVVQARARGCAGHAGTREPLHWSAAVVRAAARAERGEKPLAALEHEGYRATRVFHASFGGYRDAAAVADAFANHYCSALVEPGFTDFGFHRSGSRWLLVLAAPLEVPQLADRKAALAKVLALTNEARAHPRTCGDKAFDAAPAVRWNPQLERAAAQHAQDMAAHAYLDHRGRDGSTPAQRITRAGYRWRGVGENVASGQTTPQDVVADWLRSPGHCANLMNPDYSEMGVAYGVNMNAEAVVFWAQAFGKPR